MRTIIAGSRDFIDYRLLCQNMNTLDWPVTVVLCGMAKGADLLGKQWAEENNIPVEEYPAKWTELGKAAGYVRNLQMANESDALVAFWDGESRGTSHMIRIAQDKKLEHIKVFLTKDAFLSDEWVIDKYDPNYRMFK